MCRFIAYLGAEILLEDVLVKPSNSLINQSIHARESTVYTNGDGFGLGWYAPQISSEPALFVSVFPAWNNRNLLFLTAKIKSSCFFAHVRAATVGGINNFNCHPFIHGDWMLMHNGEIHNFYAVKRHLCRLLDDDVYHWIRGATDSEHIFALFLQRAKGKDLNQLSVVADVLQETLYELNQLVATYGNGGPSYFNICLTDGKRIVTSRYCSDEKIPPESLYYFKGHYQPNQRGKCVMVTSEKLTEAEWHQIPANHLLLIDHDHHIQMRKI